MRVLLTGSRGFIGKHLLEKLVSVYGKKSICLLTSMPTPGFDVILYKNYRELDIASYDVSDIEVVIHAGAFTPKSSNEANLIQQCNNNIYFTEQLLLLPFKKLKKIINLSTLDVYADADLVSETSAVDPVSLYGSSKLYCEKMIRHFSIEKGIAHQNLRIGHVYGPGEDAYKKIIPIAMSNVIDNQTIEIWGDGSELRSYIYIEDVVTAITNAIEKSSASDIVNVVSSNAVSITELVSTIIKISKKEVNIIHRDSRHIARNLVFDNSLLRTSLLENETDLFTGLSAEYSYMEGLREYNI